MSTPPITGYRPLSETEIALMNEGKALGITIDTFLRKLECLPRAWEPDPRTDPSSPPNTTASVDGRWLAIGKTDLQKGLMAVLRSIARPSTF